LTVDSRLRRAKGVLGIKIPLCPASDVAAQIPHPPLTFKAAKDVCILFFQQEEKNYAGTRLSLLSARRFHHHKAGGVFLAFCRFKQAEAFIRFGIMQYEGNGHRKRA
jgi:hypothetical protein